MESPVLNSTRVITVRIITFICIAVFPFFQLTRLYGARLYKLNNTLNKMLQSAARCGEWVERITTTGILDFSLVLIPDRLRLEMPGIYHRGQRFNLNLLSLEP